MGDLTPREALLRRRDEYLARVSYFDAVTPSERLDGRPADSRRFRRGGDDVPPDCTPEAGTRRTRHRVPRYGAEAREAADKRTRTGRSDEGDYDRFALGPHVEWGLPRLTAVLARAERLARQGRRLTPGQIFDLSDDDLPALDDTVDSLSKGWTLLELSGIPHGLITDRINRILLQAPWSADRWNAENVEQAGHAARDAEDAAQGKATVIMPAWVVLQDDLAGALYGILGHDTAERAERKAASPPSDDPPEDERVDWSACNATPMPPGLALPPPRSVALLLPEAAAPAADALLAAFGATSADGIVADLRALGLADPLIARLLTWITSVWEGVDDAQKPAGATRAWREAHPLPTLFGSGPTPVAWRAVHSVFYLLRVLGRIAVQSVRMAFFRLAALAQSPTFVGTVYTDIRGVVQYAGDDLIRLDGEAEAWRGLDLEIVSLADAMRARHGDDGVAIFRCALSLKDDGSYRGFVEPTLGVAPAAPSPFSPAGDRARRLADELALPGYDELSAFYWRHVVIDQTVGHILTLKETADFKVADHVRFLGLFRRGGTLRPLAGSAAYSESHEQWIASVVPDWFIAFATTALLRFKYWLEDRKTTRSDEVEMTFWSENHIVLFTSAEYITGQWWPDETFTFAGQHGTWHRERAAVRLERWLHDRLRFGFTETNSPVYYNEHLPALFNLVDFVEDERLRRLGLMVLDLIVFDVVQRVCRGSFQSATARVYGDAKTSGWAGSIRDFIEVLTGTLGEISSVQEEGAVSLCTSRYVTEVPDCLLLIAGSTEVPLVARSRTSLSFEDAEALGIGTETAEDIVFWWSRSAYFTEKTYRSTQSWSYRWNLRKSGPFLLFKYIDGAILRMLASIIGGLENIAVWVAAYTFYMPFALFFTARSIRSAVDLVTSVLDVFFAAGAWFGKEFGLLDENDDRVRAAKPVLEQEFERLAIEVSAGSVAERQELYVWRSADAMLSSMVDQKKGRTSAQREVCIASLGPDISVFVSTPFHGPQGLLDAALNTAGAAATGLLENVKFWETIPGSFAGPFQAGGPRSSPELSQVMYAVATEVASGDIFTDGPKFWQGQVGNPLVWQHENVAVAIYRLTSHQRDIAGDDPCTHAFWPWDHFDEVRTEEASGGRWVFGRRDRRTEPRTPPRPADASRPSEAVPWPGTLRWPEPLGADQGSGYIALFSARGMKTTPAGLSVLPPADENDNGSAWGHKELIADGDRNVWVTIVGDRTTYGSFDTFVNAVRDCALDASPDDGTCSVEIPQRPGPRGDDRSVLAVSWDDGATLDGQPHAELKTDDWPRFSVRVSDQSSRFELPYSVIGAAGIDGRVDWGDERWTIYATVYVPDLLPGQTDAGGKLRPQRLTLVHDFSDLQNPVRQVSNLPPSLAGAIGDEASLDPPIAYGGTARDTQPLHPAHSRLGREFRSRRQALVAPLRRTP